VGRATYPLGPQESRSGSPSGGQQVFRKRQLESRVVRAEYTRYTVPGWGVGELWTSDEAVLGHDFSFTDEIRSSDDASGRPVAAGDGAPPAAAGPGARPRERSQARPRARPHEGAGSPPTGTVPVIPARMGNGFVPDLERASSGPRVDPGALVDRFEAFLAGADVRLEAVPLDLTWATPFQQAVAASLRAVPRGEVVSYGELAALAGYLGAPRAVGTFCARNRFAFLLPCHRVVAAAGLGGYGSAGVRVKRRLLGLEGVDL
jgi:O-6-methylguanine DNA methyltransferase